MRSHRSNGRTAFLAFRIAILRLRAVSKRPRLSPARSRTSILTRPHATRKRLHNSRRLKLITHGCSWPANAAAGLLDSGIHAVWTSPIKRSRRFGALGTHGARMLNFTSILAVGAASATLLAVVRIAVLTRVLEISVYGQLTLLIITAGLVMMLLRMAIVTGTLVTAFRGEEDDDLGAGDSTAEAPPSPEPTMSESKAILGTGLTATLLITVLASSLAYLFGEPLNELLIGSTTSLQIALAVLLGGFDATFHLSSTISRYERLPVTFVLLQLFNAVSGLALATLLALAGRGLTGAILGLASGTLLSTLVALWTNRHRFTLHLSPSYLALLSKRGAPIIGITLGFWIFRHTDLFLVSRYLTESDVALYRAAARIGAIASAFLGAVLLARGPLLQGPLRDTANPNEIASAADARLFTYVLLLGLWLLVAFVLTRDLLIMVAPPEYLSLIHISEPTR